MNADRGDCVRCDGLAASDGVYTFVRFSFQADIFAGDLQNTDERGANRRKVRPELGALAHDDNIHVHNSHAATRKKFAGVLDELETSGALPFRIGIWEMRTDVTQPAGTEDRIAQRVTKHIAVGMPNRSLVEWNFNPRQNQLAPVGQAMQVVSNSRTIHLGEMLSGAVRTPFALLLDGLSI